ncbi:MAG: hypothetical protein F6J97_06645 [Leptolyngbya sp. SIO4C1]|nr:hypothetical protein [Leptolyngbya sp. SIO4C1]
MKTAISLPDWLFKDAESTADRLGVSRSELYSKALETFLQRYNREKTLAKLNEIYAETDNDPALLSMQLMSFLKANP